MNIYFLGTKRCSRSHYKTIFYKFIWSSDQKNKMACSGFMEKTGFEKNMEVGV
jgi:hypothetical protein